VLPVTPYTDISEALEFGQTGPYGQQVSVFTSDDAATVSEVIDRFSTVFGKINLNSQCGRSPDTLPFSGRRSSAMGVMSVSHALKEFSVPTVVAYKETKEFSNAKLAKSLEASSKFLEPVQK
jgi:glyceraldehyde-3-phosphate dehydrogenase (NADP+)